MHLRFLLLIFVSILLTSCSNKLYPIFEEHQQLNYSHAWERVDNYPPKRGRSDDLYFFNPERGFVINSQGLLLLTEDGGESWETKFKVEDSFFRCITFKDSLNGWIGTLGMGDALLSSRDSFIMYGTNDGGESWAPTEIEGTYPSGLCGLQTVSDKVIVGCGMVRGPSFFVKSVDGGETWKSYDLNHLAGSLIAPYFYDENHGILIGGTTTDKIECRSLVLETFDGGTTWDTIYVSKQKGEYCWKVSHPSEKLGFISIQRNVEDGEFYCLQTNDGGKNWFENIYEKESYYVQGIGFINEKLGWMGGSSHHTMETRDGGKTWKRMKDIGRGFNKFQFFGDTLAYGTGFGVFKMKSQKPLPNGLVNSYFENGNLKSKITFQNGIKTGKATYFHENGKIKSSGKLVKNTQQGTWKFYNENGLFSKKVKFKNGVAKVNKSEYEKFAGAYDAGNGTRNITLENGELFSKHSQASNKHHMIPIGNNEFIFDDDDRFKITFIKDASGKVVEHIMNNRGRESTAKRIGE